jgi:hypothetical protein
MEFEFTGTDQLHLSNTGYRVIFCVITRKSMVSNFCSRIVENLHKSVIGHFAHDSHLIDDHGRSMILIDSSYTTIISPVSCSLLLLFFLVICMPSWWSIWNCAGGWSSISVQSNKKHHLVRGRRRLFSNNSHNRLHPATPIIIIPSAPSYYVVSLTPPCQTPLSRFC